ncbi:MAG: hypothetical protein ABI667_06735 [Sphingomicrobium sp.]
MKWISALLVGAILAIVLPLTLGGYTGVWMNSWVKWGTIKPIPSSPGLLFSVPVFLGSALALRIFFNWHRN